jgi:DNA-binding winged helix-turn-helix (wHTH) protein
VRFNTYEVNLRAGELFRGGRKIPLQIQPFHVLAMLLEHPGEVVARDELKKRLWPVDTFVDFDHSLNTAIKKLRQALSDDKKKPRYIETLPKRGYRFIGTVERPAGVAARAVRKSRGGSAWVGRVARVSVDAKISFALVSVDDEAAAEREKLDAANDDVGLSLLIAAQKLFLVANGTPVRVLEMQEQISRCQVRILEGEHYGKSALIPLKWLADLEKG